MHQRTTFLVPVLWILGTIFAAGCRDSPPAPGEWSGYASVAEDQLLPIHAHLNLTDKPPHGYFEVAGERTEIPEMVYTGDSLRLIFGEYGAVMAGRLSNDRYAGRYVRFRKDTTSFPFVLFWEPDPTAPSADARHLDGTYQVVFHYPNRIDSASVAVIESKDDEITGTIIYPSGDLGLLEGRYDGSHLQLARFNGWQAILLDLEPADGGLVGTLYERADHQTPVVLRRVEADAQPGERPTRVRDPDAPFHFSGLTVEGDTVSWDDPVFDGNPIVIDVMGTWCHNCLDMAPMLEKAYEDHHDAGLQIVSMAFEISDDVDAARKNLGMFAERFKIPYFILFCGSLDQENVDKRLNSQLDNFYAYPSTLFIDRSGRVSEIHTGFNGPGTGQERYQEALARFEEAVGRIL